VNTKQARIGPRRTNQKDRRNQRKRQLVAYKGGKCERCKTTALHPAAFDFHHYDPSTKRYSLAQRHMDNSWANLTAEADKCVLLCANCHRTVHATKEEHFLNLPQIKDIE
jgi:predicted HNH restriction endonuclease